MKGLLLKDFYMAAKYCRSYILILVIFAVISVTQEDGSFFTFYPFLFAGLMPNTLLAYDERSKWTRYSGALPVTRSQLVAAKYIFGAIMLGAVTVVMTAMTAIKAARISPFPVDEHLVQIAMMFALGFVFPSIAMPFTFRFGTEKGRLIYTVVTLCMVGMGSFLSVIVTVDDILSSVPVGAAVFIPAAIAAGILIYLVSWRISVALYEKRSDI